MNQRFALYLRVKNMGQQELAVESGISQATISRFCSGGSITSDKLLRLLHVCDDLSLYWLFYGTGEMLRKDCNSTVINMGSFAGSKVDSEDSVILGDSPGSDATRQDSYRLLSLLTRKDEIIAGKDAIISERDKTIKHLYGLLER